MTFLRASRPFFVLLAALTLVGAVLRVTGYNFSLPYVDHPDEPAYTLAAQSQIDTGSSRPVRMEGYPPGIIALNFLALNAFPVGDAPAMSILPVIRLLSVAASLIGLVVVGLLAREIAGEAAGVLAAAIWALSPTVVQFARYATADSFLSSLILLALLFTLVGTRQNRPVLINAGVVLILLATVFKYQAVFILPLIVGIPLLRIVEGADRRRVLADAVWHGLAIGAFFFWLVFLYQAGKAAEIPYWAAPTDQFGFPPLDRLLITARVVYESVGYPLLWMAAAVGVLGWLISAKTLRRLALLTVLAGAVLYAVGVNLFGEQSFRQLVALGAFTAIVLGVGLTGWGTLLVRLPIRLPSPRYRERLLYGAASLALAPLLIGAIENAHQHTLPDRRNDLALYMDTSLPPAPHIATEAAHKVMNREWGGYPGMNLFPFVAMENLAARPLDEWRALNVRYALMSYADYDALDPVMRARTLPLKGYPFSSAYRGSDIRVVCLCTPQNRADGQLGSVHLIGYDLAQTTDSVTVTYYWRADAPLDGDYAVFNHLLTTDEMLVSQFDWPPLHDVRRSTASWDDPDEILISEAFSLSLVNIPPGDYQLVTGFYRRDTGQRLIAPDGSDSLTISKVTVR